MLGCIKKSTITIVEISLDLIPIFYFLMIPRTFQKIIVAIAETNGKIPSNINF